MKLFFNLSALVWAGSLLGVASGLITVAPESDGAILVNALLANAPGITVDPGSVSLSGHSCAGIFSNAQSSVGFFPDTGIVLSSGSPSSLPTQDSDSQTTSHGAAGDADLSGLIGGAVTRDACILEFSFTPDQGIGAITFNYVFGSDEYNEYVASSFFDVFGLFLNGQNIALIPGTSTVVQIDTVNNNVNSQFYNDNDPSDFTPGNIPYPDFEADGFTNVFAATGLVSEGTTNTLKLAIADTSDFAYDSWVLLEGGSLEGMEPGPEMIRDPHIKSWTGVWFDFMGACDLVLLHAKNFALHVRTTIRYEYSFIESAALRIGEDIFEVASFDDHALNGVGGALNDDGHTVPTVGGYPIYYRQISKKEHNYDVVLGPTENITFNVFKDMVSVSVKGPGANAHFKDSVGIMGAESGAMLARDGSPMSIATQEGANAFGQEWQVTGEEPMLFRTTRHPQYPLKCTLPAAKEASKRRLGETVAAEGACSQYTGAAKEACVHDVIATGDLDIAKAGAYYN